MCCYVLVKLYCEPCLLEIPCVAEPSCQAPESSWLKRMVNSGVSHTKVFRFSPFKIIEDESWWMQWWMLLMHFQFSTFEESSSNLVAEQCTWQLSPQGLLQAISWNSHGSEMSSPQMEEVCIIHTMIYHAHLDSSCNNWVDGNNPYEGFLKWRSPQIIHVHLIFHYKPSIWGYPIYGNLHYLVGHIG